MQHPQKTGTYAQVGVFTPGTDVMPRGALVEVTSESPPVMVVSYVRSDRTMPILAPVNQLQSTTSDGFYLKRLGGSPLIVDAPIPDFHRARIRGAIQVPFGTQITGAVTVGAGPDIASTSASFGTILGIPPTTPAITSVFQVVTASADDDIGTFDILVGFATAGQKLFSITFGCDQLIARLNIS